MYRHTRPHEGFEILKRIVASKPEGYFIYTSNVDGQFQKAGFEDDFIVECHGSIHPLQYLEPRLNQEIMSALATDNLG